MVGRSLAGLGPGSSGQDRTTGGRRGLTAVEGDEGTLVTDVMRPGYTWKGRVLRAAMVKVRG